MTSRRALLQFGTVTAVMATIGGGIIAGCSRSAPVFTGLDITGADFGKVLHLRSPDGVVRTLGSFKGRYVMLFFGFTQCPDVCPTALARAVEVRKLLGAEGDNIQVVFVTIDPERDTPELLRQYTAAFDPGFLGLSGSVSETEEAAKEFRIFYKKIPSGSSYTMDHTAITYVFDTEGRIRLALKHEQTASQCAQDMRSLMASHTI
ncbi:SCO family protein [Undibacterium sp. Rencai35W]|uniref:SCO family protein n=1 Tax=Undibacterium sp. Rencai35W TaxID=3413046 RepID=UPI003BF016B8